MAACHVSLEVGRRRSPRAAAVGGGLLAGIVATVIAGCGSGDVATTTTRVSGKIDALPAAVTIALPNVATGRRVPKGFLGFSIEFRAIHTYTGSDPRRINPVFEQLIRNLSRGEAPVIRIGGNSTDVSYVPTPGVVPPPYVGYPLTPGWLATTGALVHQLGARMTVGLDLMADNPTLAAIEARAFIRAFGRKAIAAFEIGNEPNSYDLRTVTETATGGRGHVRPRGYDYQAYLREFEAVERVVPDGALAGPALATGPKATNRSWVRKMSDFLARYPRVGTLTIHRYPLRRCYEGPSSKQYPSVPNLLSRFATATLADSLHRWVVVADRSHRPLRVDELNSVACSGKAGVSDTFASSLWATDALFALLNEGVDGVNIHTLPNTAYGLFDFSEVAGHWTGTVRPLYYGLQLFSQAAPPGSRLLSLSGPQSDSSILSVWATQARDRVDRVVLIDKDLTRPETVTIRPPGDAAGGATLERMQAPSPYATSGVTLGGQTYGAETATGRLAPAITQPLIPDAQGNYTVRVPAGSAALLTLRP